MIHIYQKYISPVFHTLVRSLFGPYQGCRFSPTCSEYAKQAYKKYNPLKATFLSVSRLVRCNPLFKGGIDILP